jgi:hypothetical protein
LNLVHRLTNYYREDASLDVPEIDPDTYAALSNADTVYQLWQTLEGLDWRILLDGGGILNQPEQLFAEIMQVSSLARKVRIMVKREQELAKSDRGTQL